MPPCCQCNGRNQNCTNCRCKRSNQPCRGCRKGNACRNPLGNQGEGGAIVVPPQANEPLVQEIQENEGGEDEIEQTDEPNEQGTPGERPGNDARHEEAAGAQQEDRPLRWKGMEEEPAKRWVNETYLTVVSWSANNLMEPPICAATKDMINEMICLLNNYIVASTLAPIALQIFFMMPHLLLQKTHDKAKRAENL